MKKRNYLFIAMLLLVACTKESIPLNKSSTNAINSAVMKEGDTVIFANHVYPTWCKLVTDGAEKYLLGDSVYFPINSIITRCGFVITHSSLCHTSNTTLLVDGTVIAALDDSYPWGTFGQIIFDYMPAYHITKGWHLLQFKGYSNGPIGEVAYYNIWDNSYFVATDENYDALPIKSMFKPHIRGEYGHTVSKFRVFTKN